EPEIQRVDLASTALDVIAWGGDPRTLEWFERPTDEAIEAALALLARLGLVGSGRPGGARGLGQARGPGLFGPGEPLHLTAVGEEAKRLPLHPRLARMLIAAGGARRMAQACALLSERHLLPPRAATTTSDLLSALDDWQSMPSHVQHAARVIA